MRILFVGNSLTFANDLPGMTRDFAAAHVTRWTSVETAMVATGGKLLTQHLADLQDPSTAIHQHLRRDGGWDYVVLQEQSQVPGFDVDDPYVLDSVAAAQGLAAAARQAGATPVLYMTWGFWSGDTSNAQVFPDFPTMSARLERGYRAMAAAISPPPLLVPAGIAFRAAWADEPVPLDPRGRFRRLYADDRHPTPLGTFLACSTFVAALSGQRVAGASYRPGGVVDADALPLLELADQVVFDGRVPDAGR